jgi:hypothetical protein
VHLQGFTGCVGDFGFSRRYVAIQVTVLSGVTPWKLPVVVHLLTCLSVFPNIDVTASVPSAGAFLSFVALHQNVAQCFSLLLCIRVCSELRSKCEQVRTYVVRPRVTCPLLSFEFNQTWNKLTGVSVLAKIKFYENHHTVSRVVAFGQRERERDEQTWRNYKIHFCHFSLRKR